MQRLSSRLCPHLLLIAFAALFGSQTLQAQVASGSVYKLRNQCSNKVLDVSNISQSNGALAHQWTDFNALNQQWKIESTSDGFYKLTAQHSGKALDAFRAGTSDGTSAVQWNYLGGNNQQWQLIGTGNNYYKLIARYAPSKALDVSGAGTADGVRVQLWADNGTCAQRWKLEPVSETPPPNGARLLFKSGFEGVNLSTPRDCDGTFQCSQDIIGTDADSGYSWSPRIWGSTGRFQMIVERGVTLTPSNVSNYNLNRIDTVTGRRNGDTTKALYQELRGLAYNTSTGYGQQQDPYVIEPNGSAQGDLYLRYWIKLNDNLIVGQQPDGGWGNWRSFFAWKTGGQGGNYGGDYRVGLMIQKADNGQLYWKVNADSRANGNVPEVDYWSVSNTSVPVPIGQWFKFEAFWHRSSGGDGRVWMAINGQQIVDRWGSNMGVNNDPINRLFVFQNYTGGNYPSYQWVDDVEIWDTFPSDASAH